MYKKISHNIVEEHFDHPITLPYAVTAMKGGSIIPSTMTTGTMVTPGLEPLPSLVINESTMVFRMDSRTLWTRYSLGMINFSVSDLASLASTNKVQANLSRNAAAIGNYFTPYYGITAGTKIGALLETICLNGTKVVEALKHNKTDLSVYMDIWDQQATAMAIYLNQLNPTQYPKDLIKELMVNLTAAWTDDFKARVDKDFVADTIALDNILKISVTGIPDHTNQGYSSIADILSRGIIAQFPSLFVLYS